MVGIQRRLLEHVGKVMGWAVGWTALLPSLNQSEDFTEVSLDEDEEEDEETTKDDTSNQDLEKRADATAGISAVGLINAVASLDHFRQFYETLSDQIFQHYRAAGQIKAAESITGDLAALRYELGDFRAAAMYFGSMAGITSKGSPDASLSLFAKSRWNTVVATMLKMYARCLKKLNRKDEYVRTLLDLLARSSASRISFSSASGRTSEDTVSSMPSDWLNDDKIDTHGVLDELTNYSQQLPYDVSVQMAEYFTTESAIADNGFVQLADPQSMILPQNVLPLMRADVAADAQVSAALDPVQAALTTVELTALNKQVDVDRMDPDEVATQWLTSKGLG